LDLPPTKEWCFRNEVRLSPNVLPNERERPARTRLHGPAAVRYAHFDGVRWRRALVDASAPKVRLKISRYIIGATKDKMPAIVAILSLVAPQRPCDVLKTSRHDSFPSRRRGAGRRLCRHHGRRHGPPPPSGPPRGVSAAF
jgi:hypothetical protein